MKRSRVSEEQIIGILKEHQAGARRGGVVPQARDNRYYILQMAVEVWRNGGVRRAAAEDAGKRERQTEEDVGRADDGCGDTERNARNKPLTPGSRRNALDWAMKSCHWRAIGPSDNGDGLQSTTRLCAGSD